jgi:hypothetical protein
VPSTAVFPDGRTGGGRYRLNIELVCTRL